MKQPCSKPVAVEADLSLHGLVLMLHKPAGLTVTRMDNGNADSIFRCFDHQHLPALNSLVLLEPRSEGLLLFAADLASSARLAAGFQKALRTYQVQIDRQADDALARRLARGVTDHGDFLSAHDARVLEAQPGESWLEITLCEARNRHIRRLLSAFGVHPLRCRRVALGPLQLGGLSPGEFRPLTDSERALLDR